MIMLNIKNIIEYDVFLNKSLLALYVLQLVY